jgi:hypothetical protein
MPYDNKGFYDVSVHIKKALDNNSSNNHHIKQQLDIIRNAVRALGEMPVTQPNSTAPVTLRTFDKVKD